jgi:uncharacterized membrane protein
VPHPTRPDPDEAVEFAIGMLLRVGVIVSAAVVLLGGAVFLYRHGLDPVPDRQVFRPEPVEFSHPLAILRAVGDFRGRALVQLGLLLLIATPVARVVFSAVAFLRQRDYLYLAFTLFVLAVLLFGLFGGRAV